MNQAEGHPGDLRVFAAVPPELIAQLTSASTAVDPSWWQRLINTYLVNPANPVYIAIYFGLIVFFTYFYVAITFNPEERADEMKKFMAASSPVSDPVSRPRTTSTTC